MAMAEVNERIDRYIEMFRRSAIEREGREPAWLREIRKDAIAHFESLGFPTRKHEDWRETNPAPLVNTDFVPGDPEAGDPSLLGLAEVEHSPETQLVFVNGRYSEALSRTGGLPEGAIVGSLARTLDAAPESLESYFARLGSYENQPFASLNTALMSDGAYLFVPAGVVIENPVHVVFLSKSGGNPSIAHPRILVMAGANSQAKIVESHAGAEGDVYFSNTVAEYAVGENAVLHHCKIQRDAESAYHAANVNITLGANAAFETHSVSFGGAVARNDIRAFLNGEGIHARFNGLYMPRGVQHCDHRLMIEHTKPNCESHQLFKGILAGKAHGVFRGRIRVHQDAQKTDAFQSNANLLLSPEAEADTRPQLEIYADDVKCSHGATVGRLDPEAVFYLQSRGIPEASARGLLINAYANEIVEQIGIGEIHPDLSRWILERLPNSHKFEG